MFIAAKPSERRNLECNKICNKKFSLKINTFNENCNKKIIKTLNNMRKELYW